VALTGLHLEYSRNPNFADGLTDEKVTYATLYALDDLNNFPDWFPKLARRHPGIVAPILIDALDDEWKGGPRSVLSKLSRGMYGMENEISAKLLELLSRSAPADHRMFEYALIFLFSHKTSEIFESLLTLAKQHLTQPNPSLVWMILYLRLDGNNAVTYLESYLPQCSNSTEMMVHICDKLSGEHLDTTDKMCTPKGYLQTSCLVRFIALTFQYITPATDLVRANGSYTPELRDGAQRYRDILLQTLATSSDPDTVEYLHQLLDNKYLVSYKNWMLVLIDQCRLRQSDLESWTSKDLLDFASEYNDFEPKNDGELFALIKRQLLTLQWDVERSDNSLRNEVNAAADEKKLSLWVSNKLTERSRNRYSVTRETEVDMNKRPDIRIYHPRTPPVSIEIKWAEKWTLLQLLNQLENQLVGQYLRAYNSRCGIFLLGYIGKKDKKGWVDGVTGEILDLEGVLLRLKTKANELLQTNHKIDRLEVIAINFNET
jgi:hypothetical protein